VAVAVDMAVSYVHVACGCDHVTLAASASAFSFLLCIFLLWTLGDAGFIYTQWLFNFGIHLGVGVIVTIVS